MGSPWAAMRSDTEEHLESLPKLSALYYAHPESQQMQLQGSDDVPAISLLPNLFLWMTISPERYLFCYGSHSHEELPTAPDFLVYVLKLYS